MVFKWKNSFAAWCRVERTSSQQDCCPLLKGDIWMVSKEVQKALEEKRRHLGLVLLREEFAKQWQGPVMVQE